MTISTPDRTGADRTLARMDIDTGRGSHPRVWAQRGAVVAMVLAAVLLWRSYQMANGLSTTGTAQEFIDRVEMAWWGVAAFVGIYLARPLVLFPASVLTIVGGVLFGPMLGVLVVVAAANGSAMIAYAVGRLLGRTPGDGPASSDASDSVINRWASKLRDNSFETVLIMRFLFLPYDLVNYAAGALSIKWAPFLAATALGSLPGTVSFVLLGASLDRVDQGLDGLDARALIASVVLFVASLTVARFIRHRQTAVTDPQRAPSTTDRSPATAAAPTTNTPMIPTKQNRATP